jgi:hypothetical protein
VHRTQADGGAGHHRLGAGGETVGPARPDRVEQVTDGAQRPVGNAGLARRCIRADLLFSDYHLFQLTMVIVYVIAFRLAILPASRQTPGARRVYAIGAYVTAVLM